jgi:hypothetical protein
LFCRGAFFPVYVFRSFEMLLSCGNAGIAEQSLSCSIDGTEVALKKLVHLCANLVRTTHSFISQEKNEFTNPYASDGEKTSGGTHRD